MLSLNFDGLTSRQCEVYSLKLSKKGFVCTTEPRPDSELYSFNVEYDSALTDRYDKSVSDPNSLDNYFARQAGSDDICDIYYVPVANVYKGDSIDDSEDTDPYILKSYTSNAEISSAIRDSYGTFEKLSQHGPNCHCCNVSRKRNGYVLMAGYRKNPSGEDSLIRDRNGEIVLAQVGSACYKTHIDKDNLSFASLVDSLNKKVDVNLKEEYEQKHASELEKKKTKPYASRSKPAVDIIAAAFIARDFNLCALGSPSVFSSKVLPDNYSFDGDVYRLSAYGYRGSVEHFLKKANSSSMYMAKNDLSHLSEWTVDLVYGRAKGRPQYVKDFIANATRKSYEDVFDEYRSKVRDLFKEADFSKISIDSDRKAEYIENAKTLSEDLDAYFASDSVSTIISSTDKMLRESGKSLIVGYDIRENSEHELYLRFKEDVIGFHWGDTILYIGDSAGADRDNYAYRVSSDVLHVDGKDFDFSFIVGKNNERIVLPVPDMSFDLTNHFAQVTEDEDGNVSPVRAGYRFHHHQKNNGRNRHRYYDNYYDNCHDYVVFSYMDGESQKQFVLDDIQFAAIFGKNCSAEMMEKFLNGEDISVPDFSFDHVGDMSIFSRGFYHVPAHTFNFKSVCDGYNTTRSNNLNSFVKALSISVDDSEFHAKNSNAQQVLQKGKAGTDAAGRSTYEYTINPSCPNIGYCIKVPFKGNGATYILANSASLKRFDPDYNMVTDAATGSIFVHIRTINDSKDARNLNPKYKYNFSQTSVDNNALRKNMDKYQSMSCSTDISSDDKQSEQGSKRSFLENVGMTNRHYDIAHHDEQSVKKIEHP